MNSAKMPQKRLKALQNCPFFFPASSFLITFCALTIVFALIGITPFGDRSFLVSDMYSQYSAFLSHFRRTFSEGGSLIWSSEMSLGGGTFGLWSYYLFSPLNFLTLLFPKESISTAISLIIALKLAFSAATASIFFRKRTLTPTLTIAFSAAWAMSGYATIFSFNIMWLDGMIFLPLILLGIEKIVEKKRDFLYIFALAAAIITNYYIGFMISVFCCLWFAVLLLKSESTASENVRKICHFVMSSLLAGGISGVVIVPVAFSLRGGKAQPPKLTDYLPVIFLILTAVIAIASFYCVFLYKNSSKIFRGILAAVGAISLGANIVLLAVLGAKFDSTMISMLFISSEHGSDLPGGPPMIYCGVGATILAIASFYKNSLPIKRKFSLGILLFSLIISTIVPSLNLIWHAFNAPTWFLYRYSFLIIFVILTLAAEARNPHDSWIFAGFTMSALAAFSLGDKNRFTLLFVIVNVVLIALYTLIIRSKIYVILSLCIFLESACSTYVTIHRVTNIWTSDSYSSKLKSFISETSDVVESIKKSDPDFYRIENQNPRTLNDAILIGYNGISHYSSAFSTKTINYLISLGFSGSNASANYNGGTSTAADSLLGIKYILKNSDKDSSVDIYKNETALGVAVFALGDLPYDLSGDPFEQLEATYSALCGRDMGIFDEISTSIESDDYHQRITFELNADETLCMWVEIPVFQSANYSLNGSEPKPFLDMTTHKLMKISCRKGTNIIDIASEYKLNITDIRICRENISKLEESKSLLKSAEISIEGSKIRIRNPKKIDGTLFISIPFDGAFKIVADGNDVIAREVFGGLIALETNSATEIVMQYKLPGLKLGAALTGLSLAVILILWSAEKYKKIQI